MGTRQTRNRRRYNPEHVRKVVQTVLMVVLVVMLCVIVGRNVALNRADTKPATEPTPPPSDSGGVIENTDTPEENSPVPEATDEPMPTPTPEPFEPHSVDSTAPENFLQSTDIMVDGTAFEGAKVKIKL